MLISIRNLVRNLLKAGLHVGCCEMDAMVFRWSSTFRGRSGYRMTAVADFIKILCLNFFYLNQGLFLMNDYALCVWRVAVVCPRINNAKHY